MNTPPIAQSAERAILGCILGKPDNLAVVLGSIGVEDLQDPRHQRILELMTHEQRQGRGVDLLNLVEAAKMHGHQDRYGGIQYITALLDDGVVQALPGYLRTVKDRAIQRRLFFLATEIPGRLASGRPVADVLGTITADLADIGSAAEGSKGPVSLATVALRVVGGIKAVRAGEAPPAVIPTGLDPLDALLCGGVWRKELTVIGGRPGDGKTSASTLMADAAATGNHSVLFFSTEMTDEALVMRLLGQWADVSPSRVRQPNSLTPLEVTKLEEAAEAMVDGNLPLAIDDRSGPTIEQIRATAERHKLRHGLDMVVVDYLQILGTGNGPIRLELGRISTGLLWLAKELNCAVVLLTQLNREVTKRQNKRPTMADIKECGKVEEDAHVILFPYREAVHDEDADPTAAEIIVGKSRAGATGVVRVRWCGPMVTFMSDKDYQASHGDGRWDE